MDFSGPTRLDGKAAIVTGASRGIGLAIAQAYLEAGANVCITARKQNELDEALTHLEAADGDRKGRAIAFAGSTGDPESITACVARVMSEFGRVDLLVNNAATNPAFGPLAGVTLEAWRKTFSVNVEGPLLFTQACLGAWMAENGGSILNVTTSGMYQVAPFLGTYEATKTTLRYLTKQLAGELAPRVRVNSLSPGVVKTQMSRVLWQNGEEAVASTTPMGRIGTPEDCGQAALFLASERASWVTGMDFLIDGGSLVGGASVGEAASDNPIIQNLHEGASA